MKPTVDLASDESSQDACLDDPTAIHDYEWRTRDRWGFRLLHVALYATILGAPWADFYFMDGYVFLLLGSFQPLLMLLAFGAMAFIVYMASITKEDLRLNVTKLPEALLYAMVSLSMLLGCLWLRDAITEWINQHTSQILANDPTIITKNQALFLPYLRMHVTLWSLLTAYITKTYWDHAVKLMDPITTQIAAEIPLVRRDRHNTKRPISPRRSSRSLLLLPFSIILAFCSHSLATSKMTSIGVILTAGLFFVVRMIGYSSLKRSGHTLKWARLMVQSTTVSFALGIAGLIWVNALFVALTVATGVFSIFVSIAIIIVCFLPQYSSDVVYRPKPSK